MLEVYYWAKTRFQCKEYLGPLISGWQVDGFQFLILLAESLQKTKENKKLRDRVNL